MRIAAAKPIWRTQRKVKMSASLSGTPSAVRPNGEPAKAPAVGQFKIGEPCGCAGQSCRNVLGRHDDGHPAPTDAFLDSVPVLTAFENVADVAAYRPLPGDWALATADIVGSTRRSRRAL